MKLKIIIASVFIATAAFAEQKLLIVNINNGKPTVGSVSILENELKAGWRIVIATPVNDSDSFSMGKPKQSYTSCIIYVLEKDEQKKGEVKG